MFYNKIYEYGNDDYILFGPLGEKEPEAEFQELAYHFNPKIVTLYQYNKVGREKWENRGEAYNVHDEELDNYFKALKRLILRSKSRNVALWVKSHM